MLWLYEVYIEVIMCYILGLYRVDIVEIIMGHILDLVSRFLVGIAGLSRRVWSPPFVEHLFGGGFQK